MKRYKAPEIKVSEFERENVLTTASDNAQPTALQHAQTAAAGVQGSQHTFTVSF